MHCVNNTASFVFFFNFLWPKTNEHFYEDFFATGSPFLNDYLIQKLSHYFIKLAVITNIKPNYLPTFYSL